MENTLDDNRVVHTIPFTNALSKETVQEHEEKKQNFSVLCNWKIINNKQLHDTIITAPLQNGVDKETIYYEEVANVHTSIALQRPTADEGSCLLEIKMTNSQKIKRIGVVSEGHILEIFKEHYEKTIYPDFIDEDNENSAYFGDVCFDPPTTEASIRFPRIKDTLWIYGIKLFLTDPVKVEPSAFDYDKIQFLIGNADSLMDGKEIMLRKIISRNTEKLMNPSNFISFLEDFETSYSSKCKSKIEKVDNQEERSNCENNCKKSSLETCHNGIRNEQKRVNMNDNYASDMDIRNYIESKFDDMEVRFRTRIDQMEATINQRLDNFYSLLCTLKTFQKDN